MLQAQGINKIDHWTGRKPGDVKRELPANVNVIVLVTGWLNHSMMYRIKHVAEKRGLKVIYTRKSANGMQCVIEAA